jgi:hypothetical protein
LNQFHGVRFASEGSPVKYGRALDVVVVAVVVVVVVVLVVVVEAVVVVGVLVGVVVVVVVVVGTVVVDGGAATGAVGLDVASVEPFLFVATIEMRSVAPTSAASSMYVALFAELSDVQDNPEELQRSH